MPYRLSYEGAGSQVPASAYRRFVGRLVGAGGKRRVFRGEVQNSIGKGRSHARRWSGPNGVGFNITAHTLGRALVISTFGF
ncbi:hypothetical protein [Dactylosporangium sp. CA-233914]|uniref:hypothetical protein n=1 Tax=Dactylosporangium sp. CA-233914 TaxID=3239934 RepID=UPI003D923E0C